MPQLIESKSAPGALLFGAMALPGTAAGGREGAEARSGREFVELTVVVDLWQGRE